MLAFLRGLFLEGLIYGGKFGDLASLIVGRKFTVFSTLYLRAISKDKPSGTGGGRFNGGFFA